MFSFNRFAAKMKKWYRGKYIPPPDNDPESLIVVISPGHYEQSPLAKVLGRIGKFWSNHWKWILGFIISIAGLIVAVIALSSRPT